MWMSLSTGGSQARSASTSLLACALTSMTIDEGLPPLRPIIGISVDEVSAMLFANADDSTADADT